MFDFSVDYDNINCDKILGVHKYLINKANNKAMYKFITLQGFG